VRNKKSGGKGHDRRDFIKIGGAVTAGLLANVALPKTVRADAGMPSNPAAPDAMPTRNLGRTGYRVGIFSLGGQAALEIKNNDEVAVPIITRALDLGVNYLDTSSIYGGPERWSERYVGQVMKKRRAEAFLASKTKERTRDGSLRMLEESLKLLQTDHLDLWQLHDVGTLGDVNQIFDKGGALEALTEARGRPAPLQLPGTTPAHGRRETDGHHRDENTGTRTAALFLDATTARATETFLGGRGACPEPGHAANARSALLYAFPSRLHGDHRV
jgi:hypothetical protein